MNAKNPPYTAQSCREEAAINDKFGDPIMNDPDLLRAHADALEENARLKADTSILHQSIGLLTTIDPAMEVDPVNPLGMAEHLTQYVDAIKDRMMGAEAELAKLRHAVELAARAMYGEGVDDQAQAWDVCLRILDAARADLPEETK